MIDHPAAAASLLSLALQVFRSVHVFPGRRAMASQFGNVERHPIVSLKLTGNVLALSVGKLVFVFSSDDDVLPVRAFLVKVFHESWFSRGNMGPLLFVPWVALRSRAAINVVMRPSVV